MKAHLEGAWRSLRATPRRTVLAGIGIALAAAMAAAAVTVGYGLRTGFDRSARAADLPDVLVRFNSESQSTVDRIVSRLPDLAARAYRVDVANVDVAAGFDKSDRGTLQAVELGGRRGYAVVAGHDLTGRPREALVERGLANAWHLRPGQDVYVGTLGPLRIAGIAVAPDNVAFPLASSPHVYVSKRWLDGDVVRTTLDVNQALIWARSTRNLDVLLQQARATSAPLGDVRFITRAGVRVLLDGAAGVIIALLVAFSAIALGAAAVMLAAGARAEVQRRLPAIGVQRALGASRAGIAGERAMAAGGLALAAGAAGVAAGAFVAGGPSDRLLEALNEQPPGWAVAPPLVATLLAVVAVVIAASAWPAWHAAGRRPVELLRGAELRGARGRWFRFSGLARAGAVVVGARLAAARRVRAASTIAVLGVSAAVVLLMLGLAALVQRLRDDPGSVGKRYALTVPLPASAAQRVRALPGVADAGPRWVVTGADSFALGEPVKLIAFSGDHTRFEDPPLSTGRRLRADDEAEIGQGLSQALGVGVGGTLATQLPSGAEVRFRVVGIVRALDDSGRVAYVRPARLLAAEPGLQPQMVVRLRPGASRDAVRRELSARGPAPSTVGGATTRNGSFLGVLAALLRAVAALDALVCVYALAQALTLTAAERRPTLALLRATGAGTPTIALVLAGATLAMSVPAALIAIALERFALAPLVAHLAVGYADLSPAPDPALSALVAAGLVVAGCLAAAVVARSVVREPPVTGLREE